MVGAYSSDGEINRVQKPRKRCRYPQSWPTREAEIDQKGRDILEAEYLDQLQLATDDGLTPTRATFGLLAERERQVGRSERRRERS